MRIVTAATAVLVVALAGASPALGSAFGEPRTLADWGPGGETLTVAPGAAAWSHPTGVRIARAGGDPVRIPGDGLVQDMDVASADGGPVAAWADSGARLHAFAGRETIVAGTMEGIRKIAATSSALAWIGMPANGDRRIQVAIRGDGAFSAARTPDQLGEPVLGAIAAADHANGSLFAWAANDGRTRRIELLTVRTRGRTPEARWVTEAGEHGANPAVALGRDGTGLLAWVAGEKTRLVTAAAVAADGAVGPTQVLDPEAGGPPEVAVGPDGAAVVAWPAAGRLRVALRPAGAAAFSAPLTMPADSVLGWSAAVTDRGETIVSWLDAPAGAGPRDGARLYAAVAPPHGALGAAELLAGHVSRVAGAGDELTWVESRADGLSVNEHRVRYARLLRDAAPAGGGGAVRGDRRAPKVKLRVLGVRDHRIRIAVRSDERAAVRLSLRRSGRTVARARTTLRARRVRVLRLKVPRGARRLALTLRAADPAGNVRALRRTVRLPRR
jgi:hypothetical protein